MTRRCLIFTLAALFALGCASTDPADATRDASTSSRYFPEAGDLPVGVIPSANLRDTKRDTDVQMAIDYPTRGGPHPLIIFSHGLGGSSRSYVGLATHWASYGYVVIRPGHIDTARAVDLGQKDFRTRAEDIRFVLDSLDALQQKYPELQGKIDTSRIGVGGHSLGALTSMLAGGLRTSSDSFADPRVKAIIAMSPQGTREAWGLTPQSWTTLTVPAMFMTGDRDRGIADEETPEWRREAFTHSPAGDKWLVVITGAGHASFTGAMGITDREQRRDPDIVVDPNSPRARVTPSPTDQPRTGMHPERGLFGTVKALSLAFWDAYLKSDPKGREALENAGKRGGVEVQKK